MSTRVDQEGASLLARLFALVLLPIIIVAAIVIGVFIGFLLVIGIIVDTLQFVFFGSVSAVGWVARVAEGFWMWLRGLAS